MKLARRTKEIKASPTLEITAQAAALRAQGIEIINFAAGEPDFDTPENIKEAARKAIKNGYTKYTAVGGITPLKEAIIHKLKRENRLDFQLEEIMVTCGAKQALYNISQVLFQAGDEVIIISPYWVSYPQQVILSGAKPVFVQSSREKGYLPEAEALKEKITKKTKAIIINNPVNPTGAAYGKEELEKIAELALKENIYLVADEIYEKLIYDNFIHTSLAALSSEVKKITILVNGLSKTYAMTGWRIGYAAAPPQLIKAMTAIQSQSTSNPCSIAQYAAVEALNGPQEAVDKLVLEFAKRRDYIFKRLNKLKGIFSFKPRGSFYIFPDVSSFYGTKKEGIIINNSLDLCHCLLEKFRVAAIPGIAFGSDNNLRLSYATSLEMIKEGMDRLEKMFQ